MRAKSLAFIEFFLLQLLSIWHIVFSPYCGHTGHGLHSLQPYHGLYVLYWYGFDGALPC